MRVISGSLKNRKIVTSDKLGYRPTKSIAREMIFNVLNHIEFFKIKNSIVLDLFAGSGILGLESYSRGAKKLVFVDKEPKIAKLLNDNLEKLSIRNNCEVHLKDGLRFLEKSSEFDLIFLDPPYEMGLLEKSIELIASRALLNKNGIIVAEKSFREEMILPEEFSIYKEKKLGKSYFFFLRRNN